MTEAEWLSSNDPARMLEFLRGSNPLIDECPTPPPSDRKLRLFACACCRLAGRRSENVDKWEQKHDVANETDFEWASAWAGQSWEIDLTVRAALLRDIFGNPFRPIYDGGEGGWKMLHDLNHWLAWNDRTIPRLAQQIYDSRDFSLMPVLADALEEAGCDNEEILMHCRGRERVPDGIQPEIGMILRGPHVRGCWVVDLILGKE